MKILAIETSGPVAGCALVEDDILRAEYSVQFKKKHSQSLVPMMEAVREILELDLSTVDAIALSGGPGSFTGLRIGAATAKGLGLALDRPIIPVPTVDSLAYNLFGAQGLVCPIMDARRSQVYTGIYDCSEGIEVIRPQCVVPISEICEDLNRAGKRVIFLGDGVPVYQDAIRDLLQVPYAFAPAHLSRQRATAVAALALRAYREKKEACFVSADDFRPEYLRKTQAEQERGERRNYSLVGGETSS